jgi:hypothetical protein
LVVSLFEYVKQSAEINRALVDARHDRLLAERRQELAQAAKLYDNAFDGRRNRRIRAIQAAHLEPHHISLEQLRNELKAEFALKPRSGLKSLAKSLNVPARVIQAVIAGFVLDLWPFATKFFMFFGENIIADQYLEELRKRVPNDDQSQH